MFITQVPFASPKLDLTSTCVTHEYLAIKHTLHNTTTTHTRGTNIHTPHTHTRHTHIYMFPHPFLSLFHSTKMHEGSRRPINRLEEEKEEVEEE